jgi:hypothetical protein
MIIILEVYDEKHVSSFGLIGEYLQMAINKVRSAIGCSHYFEASSH